jgi:hypothetical protein
MKPNLGGQQKPPAHLTADTRAWFTSVVETYELEEQDLLALRFRSYPN